MTLTLWILLIFNPCCSTTAEVYESRKECIEAGLARIQAYDSDYDINTVCRKVTIQKAG